MADPILVAQSKEPIFLLPKMANRHGLIAGATGTGKTVTLQTLAENFSARGVAVFMADVKGDLAGLSQPGRSEEHTSELQSHSDLHSFPTRRSSDLWLIPSSSLNPRNQSFCCLKWRTATA